MAISELVGVYDADGGLPGELAYLWGKLRGTRHCGLCDITHRRCVARRVGPDGGEPARPYYGSSTSTSSTTGLAPAVAAAGAPVVLGRDDDVWRGLVAAAELDEMAGSVDALAVVLRRHLRLQRPATRDGLAADPGVVHARRDVRGARQRLERARPGLVRRAPAAVLQPPDVVFAVMWPLNFALLLLVGVTAVRTFSDRRRVDRHRCAGGLRGAGARLGLAVLRPPPARGGGRLPGGGDRAHVGAPLVVFQTEVWAGLVLAPYALWLSVATALAVAYARLN